MMMKWLRDIDFTGREFIVSGIFVLVMLAVGSLIAGNIHNRVTEDSEKYFKALKINASGMFDYALETSVGYTLSEGTVEAIDPVKHTNIKGEYFYIKEVEEHYVQKTRRVSYKCGDKTCYKTETYWEWEPRGSKTMHAKQFAFLKRTFKYDQVRFNHDKYHSTKKGSLNVRYKYYTIPESFAGTLFAKAQLNEIRGTKFYLAKTVKQVIAEKERAADNSVRLFWVAWIVLIIGGVMGFMVLENRYLNER